MNVQHRRDGLSYALQALDKLPRLGPTRTRI
jgi:hypothetical protein